MNFCSNCGAVNLEFIIPKGDSRPRHVCKNCEVIHYSNPKMVVGCLPIWEDKVLLCKRAIEPRYGFWNVPSGYLENGETADAGAAREVWEEAEAKVEIIGVHSVYSIPQINQIYIHYLAHLVDGKFGVGEESLESKLFTKEEIPWKELAFTSSTFSIKRYFDDVRDGTRKTHIGEFRL